ncbi:D-alanyl-D-alanine carboxypeptidase family protein [Oceanicola sp. 22II-s10i]|uniref:D-alanyl-D-alanine carboxypeptidase family protein n=1 Tax=Oceanicola sp. 22II-s10i TaxID=1317116 RepID=UPI000B522362|nr:D-alanyl-D-alanine carboxypeptidase family protein [Oceanicola sp. 22II-s10i]
MVMDARTGEVLHSQNADARLHPASLTKMLTLYIAFQAIRNGEITLDTPVRISSHASSEPPSKLGLQTGQKIRFRYLIRAAAVKSANDAATAIGEALEGSEAAFARRMNRTAQAIGMTRSTFKNAHGLTEEGHLSTARDMTLLGRHLLFDFPEYYNLFGRESTDAGMREVNNTNRRFLANYKGADGIKTGYTRAAGFNLVASAVRGNERIIATVFGGRSTSARNAKVAELLDLGFRRAPSNATTKAPAAPVYAAATHDGTAGKVIRLQTAVVKSLRPKLRPGTAPAAVALASAEPSSKAASIAMSAVIEATVTEVQEETVRNAGIGRAAQAASQPQVVTRVSTSGGRHWGINVGRYTSHYRAERVLLQTALNEMSTLDGSLRKVVKKPTGFDANFLGLTRETADLACRRLQARNQTCFMIGPSG